MNKYIIVLLVPLLLVSCVQNEDAQQRANPYDVKVDSLMSLMTLEEKIGQLNLPAAGDISTGQKMNTGIAVKIAEGQVGGLFNIKTVEKIRQVQQIAVEKSRLKIPLLFGMDVIHGYKTVFPIPLGLSCTWDMDLIEESARIAAREATADGISWTFSPMVDISRDPRWGRIAEGSGEDPYLGGQVAKAMVIGYQGNDLSKNNTMMACVKHFALYGAAEGGRDYNTTDMSRQRMYNEYFEPYKAAVDAGVGSVMASFNEVDGIPATANKWLMTEVLRDQWGFDGFTLSDYTGINEMIDHGVGDFEQVTALAMNAGVDMDMVGEGFVLNIKKLLAEGSVSEAQINQACRRILGAKFELGLFDNPYLYCDENRAKQEILTKDNRKKAREIAAESFVLLKNDNKLLPIEKKKKIAVIGPLADLKENMVGTWSVAADFDKAISVLDGIKAMAGSRADIAYAKGANVVADPELEKRFSIFGKPTHRDDRPEAVLIKEALEAARRSEVIVAVMGEASEMSGESSSRSSIDLPANQKRLLQTLLDTGKPVVMVLFTGRPLALKWESETVPTILNVWFGGTEAGLAIADVLFGDVNPSGKLTTTFPQNLGQVPVYYNYKNTGRPLKGPWFEKFRSNYLDVSNKPLYPFGYGLSYTSFDYKNLKVNKARLQGDKDVLKVSVDVSNTGDRSGKEVVQLYIRDLVGTTTRPVKELKAFQKINLTEGETRTVTFEITTEDLKFYNYELKHDWEAGDFEIMVGTSSADFQTVKVNWVK